MGDIIVAIIPAAGQGLRLGGATPKQFLTLGGLSLLTRSCLLIEAVDEVHAIIVVVPPGREVEVRQRFLEPFHITKLSAVVPGGYERQDSVAAGCQVAANLKADWIVVHDAVRPLTKPELVKSVITAARESGAAIAAIPCIDTIKQKGNLGFVDTTLNRRNIWLAQTPQVFHLRLFQQAQKKTHCLPVTDESTLIETIGGKVKLVMGRRDNLKITTVEDLELAQAIITAKISAKRTGQGLDIHKLVPGKPFILGGLSIDFELGLLGHSDADVLTHAVMDALLAAAGIGDIGHMFPDTDSKFKDANSLELLKLVIQVLAIKGWRPIQFSATILAQRPKIAPYASAMATNLAHVMGIDTSLANIAATSSEGLGFIGRGEGIAVLAIAVIESLS